MREVSCKVLDPFFRAADRRGIPRGELVKGIEYPMSHLTSKHERIDWEAFERVMANVRRWFTEDDIVDIGAEGVNSPLVRPFIMVGRMLMTPVGFYRWMLSAGGLGNQMFTNLVPTFREVTPGHFVVEARFTPGYTPSREFLLMSIGGLKAVATAVGIGKDARVELTFTDVGGRFDVRVPPERSMRARLVKMLTYPLNARTAAAELEDAMRALEARYADLETARDALERQQVTLDTAYRLSHRVWGELDVRGIVEQLAQGLIGAEGVGGARVIAEGGGERVGTEAGAVGESGDAIAVDLTGRRMRGRLEAWPGEGGVAAEIERLLSLLSPTIALAVDNAFAYRELEQYQKGLERLVEERTVELRQARDQLTVTVEQLREAQEARSRFFANISHEIRTPLSLILLAVADVEARAGAALDGRAREDLASVVDSARKLLRLVDELLILAASRETELRINPVSADLGKLVAALAATWRPAADAGGIALYVDAPEQLPAVFDPVAIERVVTNLLSNAVKYTPTGGRVSLEVARIGESIRITVRDTGIGIPDELMQRLFSRFERGRNTGGTRGNGIGLSLVKELVESHHGTIAVMRPDAGGTEFVVTLPVTSSAPAEIDTPAPRLRPSDFGVTTAAIRSGEVITPRRSGATVLVAEDDPRLAEAIARLLGQEHTVVVALDGIAALELVKKHQPHLLVTDVEMPGVDGIELTRRFRELTGEKLAPVVILSAVADLGTRVAGLEAGAVDYVVKPFDPAELKARVRSQLAMRDLAMRLHRAEQLSALGTLSSGLAHELRNPANAIVNAVGPLKSLLPPELANADSPVAQLVDVLGSCAEQIGFLSRQLLSFKRGGDLEVRPVMFQEVLGRAIAQAQPSLRSIELRERVDVRSPIRCAPPLMVQVVSNLIDNASHAAGAGGWIEVDAREAGGRVVIEVADSGPGVPRELRERIFEPFFTTKAPGVGTGLGLSLARDIVHRHGGVLEVRERDGHTIFVIDLPGPSETVQRPGARGMMEAGGDRR